MITLLPRRGRTAGQCEATGSAGWLRLARVARILSWLTLAWMGIEVGVAIAAAVLAGSVALLGFGLDAVILRDKHCQWAGRCNQPANACQVHHVKHKANGGKTSVRDCVLLCWFHH